MAILWKSTLAKVIFIGGCPVAKQKSDSSNVGPRDLVLPYSFPRVTVILGYGKKCSSFLYGVSSGRRIARTTGRIGVVAGMDGSKTGGRSRFKGQIGG
jgi:hypothetical protein